MIECQTCYNTYYLKCLPTCRITWVHFHGMLAQWAVCPTSTWLCSTSASGSFPSMKEGSVPNALAVVLTGHHSRPQLWWIHWIPFKTTAGVNCVSSMWRTWITSRCGCWDWGTGHYHWDSHFLTTLILEMIGWSWFNPTGSAFGGCGSWTGLGWPKPASWWCPHATAPYSPSTI